MAILKQDPFRDLLALRERMNRIFEESLRGQGEEEIYRATWTPPVDIYDSGEGLVIEVDVPGVPRDQIQISVEDHVLRLQGERGARTEVKEDQYHRRERPYGRFARSFTLPANLDSEEISAAVRDGVLVITVPRKAQSKPRQIQVK